MVRVMLWAIWYSYTVLRRRGPQRNRTPLVLLDDPVSHLDLEPERFGFQLLSTDFWAFFERSWWFRFLRVLGS